MPLAQHRTHPPRPPPIGEIAYGEISCLSRSAALFVAGTARRNFPCRA
jgi:hypothetical protein